MSPSFSSPQSTGTDWRPDWKIAPDQPKEAKAELGLTVALADDGFRGSPIFEDPAQKQRNAQVREGFVRSFPDINQCSAISLAANRAQGTDFALQVFDGIDGRSGRLEWVLYRTDTMGLAAYGEVANPDTTMALRQVIQSVCSSLVSAAKPKSPPVSEAQPAPSIDDWKGVSGAMDTLLGHFHYDLPKGFISIPANVLMEENQKRYEAQLSEALQKAGPNVETSRSQTDGKQQTETRTTEVFPAYKLLVAGTTAPTSGETDQLPRVEIRVLKRMAMLMDAGDPAKMVRYVPDVQVLRGPEDVTIAGHKFVRTDFHFHDGDFLSKFGTVKGDYLVEFDFRANNEKDLNEMAKSMESVSF